MYPQILESYACILKIIVVIILLSMNFFTFLEYIQLQRSQSMLHREMRPYYNCFDTKRTNKFN